MKTVVSAIVILSVLLFSQCIPAYDFEDDYNPVDGKDIIDFIKFNGFVAGDKVGTFRDVYLPIEIELDQLNPSQRELLKYLIVYRWESKQPPRPIPESGKITIFQQDLRAGVKVCYSFSLFLTSKQETRRTQAYCYTP